MEDAALFHDLFATRICTHHKTHLLSKSSRGYTFNGTLSKKISQCSRRKILTKSVLNNPYLVTGCNHVFPMTRRGNKHDERSRKHIFGEDVRRKNLPVLFVELSRVFANVAYLNSSDVKRKCGRIRNNFIKYISLND